MTTIMMMMRVEMVMKMRTLSEETGASWNKFNLGANRLCARCEQENVYALRD